MVNRSSIETIKFKFAKYCNDIPGDEDEVQACVDDPEFCFMDQKRKDCKARVATNPCLARNDHFLLAQ
jgi:hypothetical protein